MQDLVFTFPAHLDDIGRTLVLQRRRARARELGGWAWRVSGSELRVSTRRL